MIEDYDSGSNVSVYANETFYFIITYSGYHFFVRDYTVPTFYLPKEVNENELGKTIKLALSQCRIVDPDTDEEQDKGFFNRDCILARDKQWLAEAKTQCGAKTKKALFRKAMSCDIRLKNNVYNISPTLHSKLDLWTGEGFTEDDAINLPHTASDTELAAAVKEVLSRCKSRVP